MGYAQKYIKCGKEGCKKCSFGEGHGPYWYRYYWSNGKQKWKYIGKERPVDKDKEPVEDPINIDKTIDKKSQQQPTLTPQDIEAQWDDLDTGIDLKELLLQKGFSETFIKEELKSDVNRPKTQKLFQLLFSIHS